MTYNAVKTILDQAQENKMYGNIFMTENHVCTFHFEDGDTVADLIDELEQNNIIAIISPCAQCFIDCTNITHIIAYKKN